MKAPFTAPKVRSNLLAAAVLFLTTPAFAGTEVGITADMAAFEVRHGNETVTVARDQDTFATIW